MPDKANKKISYMRITLIHPSRSRPQQAAATAKAWLSSARLNNEKDTLEYILSIDRDDPNIFEYISLFEQMPVRCDLVIIKGSNKSAIEAINVAAKESSGDLLIVVSDDFNTPPYHWDEALRVALKGESDFLVKTQDGLQPWIITLPIMDRVYYERFGYVYPPVYQHMWSDTEMTAVGHMLDKIITLPLVIKHNHYSTGRTPKDQVNERADSSMASGRQIFLQRKAVNFGLNEADIKKPLPHMQW